ncbi:MAG: hypothetical protein LBP69_11335 [Treponema sp.]|jgi:hypothetical protein|nr:hypothetical protein [Treponema sp.]
MSAAAQSALALRRRSGWEAADAGTLLWQKNMPALLFLYGVPLGIVMSCGFFLPGAYVSYFAFAVWWLKPLFDRLALHVVSVRFFEPQARFRRLFKGLGKSLGRGLPGDLLWRRFSPYRSSRMPLIVLEGLKGPSLKRRRGLMTPRGLSFGFPITLACTVLASVLTYGELAFVYGIFELIQPGFLGDIWDYSTGLTKYMLPLSWLNQTFIETLYVCMGFGIYINSRVETEGWDIELLFKKYAEKAAPAQSAARPDARSAGIAKPAVFCLVLTLLLPARTFAASPAGSPASSPELFVPAPLPEKSAEELKEILASKDFGSEKPSWKIQFKEDGRETGDWDLDLAWRDLDFPWLREVLGIAVRTAIVLAAVFAVSWAAAYFYRHRPAFPGRKKLAAYGIRSGAANPAELLKEAAALHAEGRIREAWAFCFRAFIASLSFRWGIAFPPEATEYEALALAGTRNGDFPRFVSRWIAFAYGGKTPEEGAFDQSVEACRRLVEDAAPVQKRAGREQP